MTHIEHYKLNYERGLCGEWDEDEDMLALAEYFEVLVVSCYGLEPRPAGVCEKCHHHWIVVCKNALFQAQKSTDPHVPISLAVCPYATSWGTHGIDTYNRGD